MKRVLKNLWYRFCAEMKESWDDAKPGYLAVMVLVVFLGIVYLISSLTPATAQAQTINQKKAFTQLLQAQYVHDAIEARGFCATGMLSNVNVVFAVMQSNPKISNSQLAEMNQLLAGGYERQITLLQKIEQGIRKGQYSSFTEVQYNFLMMCEVHHLAP